MRVKSELLLGVPVPATVEGLADIWNGSGDVLEDSFQSIPDKIKVRRGEKRETDRSILSLS